MRRFTTLALAACAVTGATALGTIGPVSADPGHGPQKGLLPPGAIQHIMVIDVENEGFAQTFGNPTSYIGHTLEPQGELLKNYYATGHVSLDNYIAQVSGQAPNNLTNSDCSGFSGGEYNDVVPGTLDPNRVAYPGQVDGQGCVFPSSVQTIGNQLDAAHPSTQNRDWRVYAEDMGNDPARDGGTPDPTGGTDCAHPAQTAGVGVDLTENAQGPNATGTQVPSPVSDQYADRHNPFIFFHAVTDNTVTCNQDVVPLGTESVGASGSPVFSGHLAQDLSTPAATPRFSFVVPNLCDDGHDATCAGTNATGGTTGGLTAVNEWLATWMPLILNSPAYLSGHMLVVLTADEGNLYDTTAGDHETAGPNNSNPGYSPLLNVPIPAYHNLTYYQLLGIKGLTANTPPPAGTMPGGGQIGALLLNPVYVHAGTVDTTGSYNHYSALRTYEDLLGVDTGGADGQGHLGFAATATDFGPDVFSLPQQ
jgi:phosphatidylinositol-3-phosphatase